MIPIENYDVEIKQEVVITLNWLKVFTISLIAVD